MKIDKFNQSHTIIKGEPFFLVGDEYIDVASSNYYNTTGYKAFRFENCPGFMKYVNIIKITSIYGIITVEKNSAVQLVNCLIKETTGSDAVFLINNGTVNIIESYIENSNTPLTAGSTFEGFSSVTDESKVKNAKIYHICTNKGISPIVKKRGVCGTILLLFVNGFSF